MNASQIHLALTHIPVVLSLTGIAILIISMIKKQPTVTRISFYILLVAGIATLPVFFSGEGAEEIVEHLPGVSEALIEKHEDVAQFSLFAILATALIALAGLVKFPFNRIQKAIPVITLLFGFTSTVLISQTAHLGGQIRHTEIRNGSVAQNGNEAEGSASEIRNENKENDD